MYPVFRHREYTNVQRQASEQTNEQTAAVVDFTFQREKKAKNTIMYPVCIRETCCGGDQGPGSRLLRLHT